MLKKIFYSTCKIRHCLAVLFFLCLHLQNFAQVCSGCKTVISSNTSANMTIGPSDVVCILPGVSASGNITLNGGTLCNEGTVSNLTLIEGYFYNHGTFSKPTGNLNITNAKNLWIDCYGTSSFDLTNAMNIDALTNADSVMINVYKGAKFSIGKSLSMSKGWLKIRNALDKGHEFLPIQSYFNIGGQLNVSNAALRILNNDYGILNINAAVNLEGKYNKTILNYGLLSCNNSFNISGNGQNQYNVQIENNGTFNISRHLNSAYNNGTVTINNNDYPVKPQPSFYIGKSLTLSKANNIFNNKTTLTVEQDIFLENGSLTNTRNVYVNRDVEVKNGALTNGNSLFIARDLLLTNNSAVVNNDYELRIGRLFSSKGTVNFGKKSFMVTKDFTHLNGGNIYGPADLLDANGINDSTNYALINITDYSDNSGNLRQHLIVYDENFSGTGIALDDYHGNILKLGMPPVIIGMPCFKKIFSTELISDHPNPINKGTSVILTAISNNNITLLPSAISQYKWLPSNTVTTPPTYTYSTPNLTSNTSFSVIVTFTTGCSITKSLLVTVPFEVIIDKEHVLDNGENTGYISVTPNGGLEPYHINWNNQSYSNVIGDLNIGVYTATVVDSLNDTIVKTIYIGKKPSWRMSENADYSLDKISLDKSGQLGRLVSNNVISNDQEGWIELTINDVNQDMSFGFLGIPPPEFDPVGQGYSYSDPNYPSEMINNDISLATTLLRLACRDSLTISNGELNMTQAYDYVNLVKIRNGAIRILFNGEVISSLTYNQGDVLRLGRNAAGNLYLARNNAIIYSGSGNRSSQNLFSAIFVSSNVVSVSDVGIFSNKVSNPLSNCPNDANKNWVYTILYDGNNNIIEEVKTFSDYLGRPIQMLDRDVTKNNVIASEIVYDAYGKGSLNTLRAPTFQTQMCFKDNFVTNGSGVKYSYNDYDKPNYSTSATALTLGERDKPNDVYSNLPGTLGWYYGDLNNVEPHVPTSYFPYVRSEESDVNPGELRKSSLAGEQLQHGSGHETYHYSMPIAGELFYVFGFASSWILEGNNPNFSNYGNTCADIDDIFIQTTPNIAHTAIKQITVDENGTENVSFTDTHGNLIATCLSGLDNGVNVNTQNVISYIVPLEEGRRYVDIHLPKGCETSLVLPGGSLIFNIMDLKTEQFVKFSSSFDFSGTNPNLPAGYYRIILKNWSSTSSSLIPIKYNLNYYNYSINYYDKNGRLKVSIPPSGIDNGYSIAPIYNINSATKNFFQNSTVNPTNFWSLNNSAFDSQIALAAPSNVGLINYFNCFISLNGWNKRCDVGVGDPEDPGNSGDPQRIMAFRNELDGFTSSELSLFPFPIDSTNFRPIVNDYLEQNSLIKSHPSLNDLPQFMLDSLNSQGIPLDSIVFVESQDNQSGPNDPNPDEDRCKRSSPDRKYKIDFNITDQNNNILYSNGSFDVFLHIQYNGWYWTIHQSVPTYVPYDESMAISSYGPIIVPITGGNSITGLKLNVTKAQTYQNPGYSYGPVDPYFNYLKLSFAVEKNTNPTLPVHKMPETNDYDSFNELLSSSKQDKGKMRYVYSRNGKLKFSQNSAQYNFGTSNSTRKFSYADYDDKDRMIEFGEYNPMGLANAYIFEDYYEFLTSTALGSVHLFTEFNSLQPSQKLERTYMSYDTPDPNFYTATGLPTTYKQEFLLGSVSVSYNSNKTTWYSYDEFGRTKWTVQKIENMNGVGVPAIKTIEYEYDFNGDITKTIYQKGVPAESFYHYYEYDADKRLKRVFTSRDDIIKEEQAEYYYYLHGPLKRVELGSKSQGIDYVYTINGWLKAQNAPEFDFRDPGKDGLKGSLYRVPKDLFGYALDYFDKDYSKAGTNIQTYMDATPIIAPNMYNGIVKDQRWQTKSPTSYALTYPNQHLMYGYQYDKKYQIKEANFAQVTADGNQNPPLGEYLATDDFMDVNVLNAYKVYNLSYDQNGNIKTLTRNAHNQFASILPMDNLVYNYQSCTNKLTSVTDGFGSNGYNTFEFNQGGTNTYSYDDLGQLTSNNNDGKYYSYDIHGSILGVYSNSTKTNPIVTYKYDENGTRISKKSYLGTSTLETWYIKDANGNIFSTYENNSANTLGTVQTELNVGASNRIGVLAKNGTTETMVYELDDYLGNTRATYRKMPLTSFSTGFDGLGPYDYLIDGGPTIDNTFNITGPPGASVKTIYPSLQFGAGTRFRVYPGQQISASIFNYNTSLSNYMASPNPPTAMLAFSIVDASNTIVQWDVVRINNAVGVWDQINKTITVNNNPGELTLAIFPWNLNTLPIWWDNLNVNITPNPSGQTGLYVPDQLDVANYYPHGSEMPGLTYNSSLKLKYGYQGQFTLFDKEINETSFELRNYNGLLGRFNNPDFMDQFHSTYCGMGNNPLNSIDPSGGFSYAGAIVGGIIGAGVGIAASEISYATGGHRLSGLQILGFSVAGSLIGGFSDTRLGLGLSMDALTETIYVAIKHDPWNPAMNDYGKLDGHLFLSVGNGTFGDQFYGFRPAPRTAGSSGHKRFILSDGWLDSGDDGYMLGSLQDNTYNQCHDIFKIKVTKKQKASLERNINKSIANPGKYSIFGQRCAGWGMKMLLRSNILPPNSIFFRWSPTPATNYLNRLDKNKKYIERYNYNNNSNK